MAGLIVTIAQQKGGAGKTTLAAHLAVAYVVGGNSVAVLDVDPQGSLGEWFERRERRLGEGATGLEFRTASGWGARREAQSSPATMTWSSSIRRRNPISNCVRRSRSPRLPSSRSSRRRSTCGRPSRRWP